MACFAIGTTSAGPWSQAARRHWPSAIGATRALQLIRARLTQIKALHHLRHDLAAALSEVGFDCGDTMATAAAPPAHCALIGVHLLIAADLLNGWWAGETFGRVVLADAQATLLHDHRRER